MDPADKRALAAADHAHAQLSIERSVRWHVILRRGVIFEDMIRADRLVRSFISCRRPPVAGSFGRRRSRRRKCLSGRDRHSRAQRILCSVAIGQPASSGHVCSVSRFDSFRHAPSGADGRMGMARSYADRIDAGAGANVWVSHWTALPIAPEGAGRV